MEDQSVERNMDCNWEGLKCSQYVKSEVQNYSAADKSTFGGLLGG